MTSPFVEKAVAVLGTWNKPPDMPTRTALVVAVVLAAMAYFGRGRSILGIVHPESARIPTRVFLAAMAFAAAMLSIFYIAFYLRGGPRIIDATAYFLQGRAMSHGDLAWDVGEPSASFRGRFLDYRPEDGHGVMGGIFPPGYPLLLAIGFALQAPMITGPLIAGALVFATYRLAKTLAERTLDASLVEPVARSAAIVSLLSATLRYHTAETMSHGASALGVTLALDCVLRGRTLLSGIAIGAVVATRPVSALPIALLAAVVFATRGRKELRARSVALAALGVLPGLFLLGLSQKAVTGSWFASAQRMYYAMSDGPPDCFRWAFGRGAGCLNEHGEFVRARLPNGLGVLEAAGVTLRRLRMHVLDIANFEPLALLVLVPLFRTRARSRGRTVCTLALLLVAAHMLAYAPFYFDGNYPGGGGRLFADVLPVEHALLAIGIALLVRERVAHGAFAVFALALAGFAVHGAFEHLKLANRDGGKPMFEPDVLARANLASGLVFVETDHGFLLGHDPAARPKDGILVARFRSDERDRLLYDALGRPPTYLYKFELPKEGTDAAATTTLVPWVPPVASDPLRFEAEAEWPALAQTGGFAAPAWTATCASGARALVLTPTPAGGRATASLLLPVPESATYTVVVRIVHGAHVPFTDPRTPGANVAGSLFLGSARWDWVDSEGGGCVELGLREVNLTPPSATLTLEARGGAVALDRLSLHKQPKTTKP